MGDVVEEEPRPLFAGVTPQPETFSSGGPTIAPLSSFFLRPRLPNTLPNAILTEHPHRKPPLGQVSFRGQRRLLLRSCGGGRGAKRSSGQPSRTAEEVVALSPTAAPLPCFPFVPRDYCNLPLAHPPRLPGRARRLRDPPRTSAAPQPRAPTSNPPTHRHGIPTFTQSQRSPAPRESLQHWDRPVLRRRRGIRLGGEHRRCPPPMEQSQNGCPVCVLGCIRHHCGCLRRVGPGRLHQAPLAGPPMDPHWPRGKSFPFRKTGYYSSAHVQLCRHAVQYIFAQTLDWCGR